MFLVFQSQKFKHWEFLIPATLGAPLVLSFLLKTGNYLLIFVLFSLTSLLLLKTKPWLCWVFLGLLIFVSVDFFFWKLKTSNVTQVEIEDVFRVKRKFANTILVSNNSWNFLIKKLVGFSPKDGDLFLLKLKATPKPKSSLNFFHLWLENYFEVNSVEVKKQLTFNYSWKDWLRDKIFSGLTTKNIAFLQLLLLGEKNIENYRFLANVKNLGLTHLFVISGFHISALFRFLNFLPSKFFPNKTQKVFEYFICLFLLFYAWFLNWSIPASRAVLLLLLQNVFFGKQRRFQPSKFECLSMIQTIFFLTQPSLVFSLSFVLSFFTYYLLLLTNQIKLSRVPQLTSQFIFLAIYSYIISLSLNGVLVLLTPLFQVFLAPLTIFCYSVTLLFFWTNSLLSWNFWILEQSVNFFKQFSYSYVFFFWTQEIMLLSIMVLLCSILFLVWKTTKSRRGLSLSVS